MTEKVVAVGFPGVQRTEAARRQLEETDDTVVAIKMTQIAVVVYPGFHGVGRHRTV